MKCRVLTVLMVALALSVGAWAGPASASVLCPVYQRERLPAGAGVNGPAIVEEFGATLVLFPGWRASLDRLGNLFLDRG